MAEITDDKEVIRIFHEIFDSVTRIERDVNEIKEDVGILKSQFENQALIDSDEECYSVDTEEEQTPVVRVNQTSNKLLLTENPDHRGARTVDLGWVWEDKRLTLVERYHTLFQILHKIQNGENVEKLKETELIDLRKKLLKTARVVRNMIYIDFPGIRYFTELVTADQHYYQLVLEEKVSKAIGMNIFLCKDMWCARTLLRESFKSGNRGITTLRDIAREKVKRRKAREKDILKEKARAKEHAKLKMRQKFKEKVIKVEPEEDPKYIALSKVVKSEESAHKRLRPKK